MDTSSQSLDWLGHVTGAVNEVGSDIEIDANGNIFIIGGFDFVADLDPTAGVYSVASAGGLQGSDHFITKLDSSGNFIWAKTFGSVTSSLSVIPPTHLEIDDFGNLYIMGWLKGFNVDFDPGPGVFNLSEVSINGDHDTYFLKLDTAGNFVWAKSLNSDQILSFSVDGSGNIYTTGSGYIEKWDNMGNLVWLKQLAPAWMNGGSGVNSVIMDAAENVYATGSFSGQVDFDPGAGVVNMFDSSGTCFVLKLNSSGDFVWVNQFGKGGDFVTGMEIKLDSLEQNLIVAGGFMNTADFDPGPSIDNISGPFFNSVFVEKMDTSGNFIWIKRTGGQTFFSTSTVNKDLQIELDNEDNIYIRGQVSADDFDPGLGIFILDPSIDRTFIQKIDSSGNLVWIKPLSEGFGRTTFYSIKLTKDNGILLIGEFQGTYDFDPSPNINTLTNTSNQFRTDMFISKWNQDSCAYNISLIIDSAQNISCSNTNGYVSAQAVGGTAPYSYSWDTNPVINNFSTVVDTAKIFNVTVNDASGCSKTAAVLINGPTSQAGFDLNSNMITTSFRPGFPAIIWLDAFNDGCIPTSGQLSIVLSQLVSYDSSSIIPNFINGDTLIWNFSSLIYDSIYFQPKIFVTTDTSASIGNQVCFDVQVSPIIGDVDTLNNLKNYCFDVINGYDPNDKKVFPKGECNENYVLNDQILTYSVRFQNTGNASAIHVQILDSLSANLDVNSVRIISKSHDNLITEVVAGNILKFRFDNIMLADSATNEIESHGFVVFEVQPLSSLPNGTEIKNNVGIYFDFNPVVITNSTLTTLNDTLNFSTFGSITDSVCNSFEAPSGKIYTSSGNYIDVSTNSAGCDSIIALELVINDTSSATLWESQCIFYTSPSGNYTWTIDGIYNDTIPNAAGCDSVMTINLTIDQSDSLLFETRCLTYTTPSGSNVWNVSGIYEDTIPNYLGCDSILTINLTINNTATFKEVNKVVATYRGVGDYNGKVVAIDNQYAIVGNPYNDFDTLGGNVMNNAGSVYIYKTSVNSNWTLDQTITSYERDPQDEFGTGVAISGDYAIVGAPSERTDTAGGNPFLGAGAAYLLKKDGNGEWVHHQKLVASDRGPANAFGHTVTIDNDYVVVGAFRNGTNAAGGNFMSYSGSAYVFENDGLGNWSEVQKIVASDRTANDYFSFSLAIDGDYIISSGYRNDVDSSGNNSMSDAGAAYVFERTAPGVWTEKSKLVAFDRSALSNFGYSVSVNGDYAVVGAYMDELDSLGGSPLNEAGSAYVYKRNASGGWDDLHKMVPSDRSSGDHFGVAVDIFGSSIVIGSPLTNTVSGSCYIYRRKANGDWFEFQKFGSSDGAPFDNFGNAVSITSGYLIAAANLEDHDVNGMNSMSNAGSAYLYNDDYNSTININSCNSYTLNAQTYTSTGTYQQTITTALGCDSIVTLNLTVSTSSSNFLATACSGSYVSPSGNYTWFTPGIYNDTIPNAAGCDSLMTINLSFSTSSSSVMNDTICTGGYTSPSGNYIWNTSGTYNDTIPNSTGCDSLLTINLIQNSSSSTFNDTSCLVYISPSGNYTWNQPGIYNDTIPNYLGCDSLLTINLTITNINPTVIQNGNILTSLGNGTTYQWIDCTTNLPIAGATNQVFISTASGSYAVVLTQDGCVDTSICTVVNLIGVEELENNIGLEVYPNPNAGLFVVKLPKDRVGKVEIILMDASSKIIMTKNISYGTNFIEFDITNYSKGIYYLQIIMDNTVYQKKLIKD